MTLLEQQPLDDNGRKKDYIRIMSELWDTKGYGDLGLSSQNLRNQAARLEKTVEESPENLSWEAQTDANSRVLPQRNVSIWMHKSEQTWQALLVCLEETGSESQYANLLAPSNQDLHTASTPQIPGDVEQKEHGENHLNSPGCLPEYITIYKPSMINWGKRSDSKVIVISTSVITDAYNEIATWRKNGFLVPYGKVGRDFIDQVTLHINDWNSGSDNQHIPLKAAFVLLAVGLQKPSPKSKEKDHQDVLSKRLIFWRQGEINKLL